MKTFIDFIHFQSDYVRRPTAGLIGNLPFKCTIIFLNLSAYIGDIYIPSFSIIVIVPVYTFFLITLSKPKDLSIKKIFNEFEICL